MSEVRIVEGVFQDLPVELTKDEIVERSAELASTVIERSLTDESKKESAKDFSGKIKSLDRRIEKLSLTVRDGREVRSVECYRRFDYGKNSVETFRSDNGERVSSRAMTSEERQLDIPDDGPLG